MIQKMAEGVKGTRKHTMGCQWCRKCTWGDAMATKKHIKGVKFFFFGHWEGHWRMTMAPRSIS
jgi:hypothetical protein